MQDPDTSTSPFSALEISGAVSARVMHDLSNLLSGIIGNAEYAARATSTGADLSKVINAISTSANSAGRLLGQCLPLQQALSRETFPVEVSEQAAQIVETTGFAPGWRAVAPAELGGQIKVQPCWLTSLVWQIARETCASHGEVQFACGPAEFPIVWHGPTPNKDRALRLFQISLRYKSEEPLVSDTAPVTPDRPALLAAFELIKRFKGQIQSHTKPPARQEISILLPLL
jgi:signal transduction histidine kinase